MRVVVALGGNALQKRGEPMTVDSQRANVRLACQALSPLALEHDLIISHGNGPQVGLLALQASSYDEVSEYPFDVLGAQTEGMIGYFIEQELGNLLPPDKPIATILTMTEVDADDPAMIDPTKFVGPVYTEDQARELAAERAWVVKQDGDHWRRVVPSPEPKQIIETGSIRTLVDKGTVVVCTGGGGIPTMFLEGDHLEAPWDHNPRELVGVEAVIDKDRSTAVLAKDLDADLMILATDADAVYLDWGTPDQRAIHEVSPDGILAHGFAAGSMGPKVEAAADFARSRPGKVAVIGALGDLEEIIAGTKGTRIVTGVPETTFYG